MSEITIRIETYSRHPGRGRLALADRYQERAAQAFDRRERAAAEKAWDEGFDTGDAGAVLAENPYRAAEIREGQP